MEEGRTQMSRREVSIQSNIAPRRSSADQIPHEELRCCSRVRIDRDSMTSWMLVFRVHRRTTLVAGHELGYAELPSMIHCLSKKLASKHKQTS